MPTFKKSWILLNAARCLRKMLPILMIGGARAYSIIDGLGKLAGVYRMNAGATTTITSIPADASIRKYNDEGTNSGSTSSELGNVVSLVNTLRGNYSSSNPAKSYFNYPRPFRWKDNSIIVPTLIPVINPDPNKDGGFPSGHTNAAYLSAFAMAYAIPERYQEPADSRFRTRS